MIKHYYEPIYNKNMCYNQPTISMPVIANWCNLVLIKDQPEGMESMVVILGKDRLKASITWVTHNDRDLITAKFRDR